MEDDVQDEGGVILVACDAIRIEQHTKHFHEADEPSVKAFHQKVCGGIFRRHLNI